MNRRLGFAFLCLLLPALALGADKNVDAFGDPLPEGATLRLGTARLRSPSGSFSPDSVIFSALTPDGKFLVGRSSLTGLVFVDPATGKTVRAVAPGGNPFDLLSEVVAVSADGTRAVTHARGGVAVIDTATAKVVARVDREVVNGHDVMALSADGKRLAIGSERQVFGKGKAKAAVSVVVWDVDADKQLAIATPDQTKASVALSPDGKRLATWGPITTKGGLGGGGFDGGGFGGGRAPAVDSGGTVQFWDAESGKELGKVQPAGRTAFTTAAFPPDGALAAVSAGTGSIHLIDFASGKEKQAFFGCAGQGHRLAFSPDGKTLAAASEEEVVQRWSVADGRLLGTTEPPSPPNAKGSVARFFKPTVRALTFADNARVLVWSTRGDLNLVWEAPSGKALSPTGGHAGPVTGLVGGDEILTASEDGTVARWDAKTGKQLGNVTLRARESSVTRISPNRAWALTTSASTAPVVYALPSGRQQFAIPGIPAQNGVSFSRDGTKVVTATAGNEKNQTPSRLTVWELATAKRVATAELPANVGAVALTPDCKTAITGSSKRGDENYVVTGWELATGKKLGEIDLPVGGLAGGAAQITAITDATAIIVTPGGQAAVVDFVAGKKLFDIGAKVSPFVAPAVSPDGKHFAVCVSRVGAGDWGSDAVVFDTATGKAKKTFGRIDGQPTAITFSPDGKTLLTASRDTTVLVWDLTAP